MYFVHGRNTVYNYAVMRFMFLNGSEASSAVGGIVRLRGLNDISTSKKDDEYDNVPLYASSLPYEVAIAVRHLRAVQRNMPSEYNTPLNAERYLVTCYATWAYTQCFLDRRTLDSIDMAETVALFAHNYESSFTMERFLSAFSRYEPAKCKVRIIRAVQADYVTRAIALDPVSIFAKVARSSVRPDNDSTFFHQLHRTVSNNFHVFPLRLISTSAPIDHWIVVKHGDNAILSTGEHLTVQLAREKMRLAKLRKKRSNKRRRIVSSSSSSSATAEADNNDDKADMNVLTVAKSRRTRSSGYQTAISSQRTANEKTSLNIVADYVESVNIVADYVESANNNVVLESNRPSSPFAYPEDLVNVAILTSNDGQSDKLMHAIPHCSKDQVPYIEPEPLAKRQVRNKRKHENDATSIATKKRGKKWIKPETRKKDSERAPSILSETSSNPSRRSSRLNAKQNMIDYSEIASVSLSNTNEPRSKIRVRKVINFTD
ncbi:unnamed protein product [Lasius platythorax]|uniref:Uncharacterized protein n=1 Tax=Lasius platythorax TaxID=488582 RepID=A0AAV2MZE1_9HYME